MNGSMKLPSGAVAHWNFKAKWIANGRTFIDYRTDTLSVSSGLNNPSQKNVDLTNGSVAFTLDISHNHSKALKAGFRQAVRCQFSTMHYAGAKEEDGCIITSTAGALNMTWQIDASPGPDGLAPNSPYFQWPMQIPSSAGSPGATHTIQAADEPAAILPLTRTNPKTRKFNYLIAHKRREQFVTVAYIEDVNQTGQSTPVPLEAIIWRYDVDLSVAWTEGVAARTEGTNRLSPVDVKQQNIHLIDGFSRIHVADANKADNMVKIRGDASLLAYSTESSNSSYTYDIYEKYAADIRAEIGAMPWRYEPHPKYL